MKERLRQLYVAMVNRLIRQYRRALRPSYFDRLNTVAAQLLVAQVARTGLPEGTVQRRAEIETAIAYARHFMQILAYENPHCHHENQLAGYCYDCGRRI